MNVEKNFKKEGNKTTVFTEYIIEGQHPRMISGTGKTGRRMAGLKKRTVYRDRNSVAEKEFDE